MGVVDFRYINELFNLPFDLFNPNPIDRAYFYCSFYFNIAIPGWVGMFYMWSIQHIWVDLHQMTVKASYEYYNVFPLYFCYHHIKRTTTLSLQSSKQRVSLAFHENPEIKDYLLHPMSCFCCFELKKVYFVFQDVFYKKMSVQCL